MDTSHIVRWAWRLGGGLVTFGVLVMGVTQVVLGVAHEEYTVERTFDGAGIAAIDVRSSSGSVRVVGSDNSSDTITVTAHVSDGLRKTGHEEYVQDDRLRLEATCPFLSNFCDVSYEIEAPPGVDVNVRTEGSVTASYVRGDVDLDSDHGRIEVVGIDGDVRLHSSHGSVSAAGLTAPSVDASSSHGSVSVELEEAPLAVNASSAHGDVEVAVPEEDGIAYQVDESGTDHGVLATPISTDPSSDRSITATSGHGDVTIRYGR